MTTLYEFSDVNLGIPETLIEADDGMLWGTARGRFNTGFNGYSSIFRLNPDSGAFQTIYKMKNGGVTGACECWMIQGSDGNFYGTTENEGTYQGGTIFQLDAGLPPPKPHIASFGPNGGQRGTEGAAVGIEPPRRHGGGFQRDSSERVRRRLQPRYLGRRSERGHQRSDHGHDAEWDVHDEAEFHAAVTM
jgi:uncharacterized repeat protein (TIGR03803 family)